MKREEERTRGNANAYHQQSRAASCPELCSHQPTDNIIIIIHFSLYWSIPSYLSLDFLWIFSSLLLTSRDSLSSFFLPSSYLLFLSLSLSYPIFIFSKFNSNSFFTTIIYIYLCNQQLVPHITSISYCSSTFCILNFTQKKQFVS